MPQSLHVLYAHIVFSTKSRVPALTDLEIRPRLWAYMAAILRNLECMNPVVGGHVDHVHIVCNLSKKHPPMKIVEITKKDSSKWLKTQAETFRDFHWQDGYGLFSISPAHYASACHYVENQDRHHQRVSFQDELRRILQKYCVTWDERYLWD